MASDRNGGDGYRAAYWAARVTLLNLVPGADLHARIETARSMTNDGVAAKLPDVGIHAGNAVAVAFEVAARWQTTGAHRREKARAG